MPKIVVARAHSYPMLMFGYGHCPYINFLSHNISIIFGQENDTNEISKCKIKKNYSLSVGTDESLYFYKSEREIIQIGNAVIKYRHYNNDSGRFEESFIPVVEDKASVKLVSFVAFCTIYKKLTGNIYNNFMNTKIIDFIFNTKFVSPQMLMRIQLTKRALLPFALNIPIENTT